MAFLGAERYDTKRTAEAKFNSRARRLKRNAKQFSRELDTTAFLEELRIDFANKNFIHGNTV